MAKQNVGSSTDRWQRPPSRGSGLLPLPSTSANNQNQPPHPPPGVISPSGIASGPVGGSTGSQPHHHHPPPPQQPQHAYQPTQTASGHYSHHHHLPPPPNSQHSQHPPPVLHPRKKSIVCGGSGQIGSGGGQRGDFIPPPGMSSEQKDRNSGRSGGHCQGQGQQGVPPHQQQQQQPPQGTCSGDITTATATAIVHQHDLETLESSSRNPLLCLICNNVYDDPRLLSCYHSFCAKCLPGRLGDVKIVCPLCGKPTALKDGSGPPSDHLLRFLLHSSPGIRPSCANCDNKSRAPMYYCNTCGQVLCQKCREETHRAKMFSTHDVIPVSKYTKESPKKCSIHGEQFIMFSNVQKTMLCINCYRDTAMESRLHCVDLETAYSVGCRKLDRAVMSLRDLQVAVRDGITMLKNVLEELRRNSDSEKSAVNAVCQTILDALTKTQENLLKDVDCQTDGKDKVIRGQLCQLRSVLPTIKLHLTMCQTIANATNKYDFLDLAYPLIDRLTAITHMGYPIRPGQSSQIKSTYKIEMARTLEPWVSESHHHHHQGGGGATTSKSPLSQKDYSHPTDPSLVEPTYSQYYPMSRSTVAPAPPSKGQGGAVYAAPIGTTGPGPPPPPPSGRKTPVSKGKGDGPDEHFAAHCRSFTAHVNELNQRLSRLKEQVQELHRDVTLQRGREHSIRAESALREGFFLEDQLERRHAEMERIRKHLESHWNDNMRQIRLEQEVFQSQINNLLAMKSEVKQLSSLLQQLQSFLKSLSARPPPSSGSGSGPGGGGGGGVGGNSTVLAQSNMAAKFGGGGPIGSSGQGVIHQGQSNRQTQHVHHLTTVSDPFSSRADSGSQVTPSLGEMAYLDQSKDVGLSQKSDPNRLPGRSYGPPPPQRTMSISGPSTSTSTQRGDGSGSSKPSFHQPSSFAPRPTYKQPNPAEMEYIQVDTSYTHPHSHHHHDHHAINKVTNRPVLYPASESSMKKGVLSQLMDKVRSKDDRKKSTASSSSGGTQPVIPTSASASTPSSASASALAARRALTMYDAQCQSLWLDSSTSAVSALALANSNLHRGRSSGVGGSSIGPGTSGGGGPSSSSSIRRQESPRPSYQRAKSFVKSKSDDERPPSKLSQQLRARSAGQLETESLLRSLSSGTKDASRILELYQSLSKTIMERETHTFQRQSYPQSYNPYSDPPLFDGRGQKYDGIFVGSTVPPKSSNSSGGSSYPRGQSNSLGRIHSSTQRQSPVGTARSSSHPRPEESLTASEDDYQQIPYHNRSLPISRSHSAPPRKPVSQSQQHQHHAYPTPTSTRPTTSGGGGGGGHHRESRDRGSGGQTESGSKEVKVFVHEEPRPNARSTRTPARSSSSPPATTTPLSKSLEESYLYGYLSQHHSGGLTSSSSGQSSGPGRSAFSIPPPLLPSPLGKKPSSEESLVSIGALDPDGTSRKSSIDFDRRSVVTVRRAGSKSALMTRQHSWEGGGVGGQLSGGKREVSLSTPHLSPTTDDPFESGRSSVQSARGGESSRRGGDSGPGPSSSRNRRLSARIYDDEEDLVVGNTLHKADSFEGHEEAVRSIVAAVQETRTLQRRLQSN